MKRKVSWAFIAFLNLTRKAEIRSKIRSMIIELSEQILNLDGTEILTNCSNIRKNDAPVTAITPAMKQCWLLMLQAIEERQPVLLSGPAGCGKSESVRAFGTLLQKKMLHLHITPQTEPEALVGCLIPTENSVKWQEGIVTRAVRRGFWHENYTILGSNQKIQITRARCLAMR